MGVTAEEAAVVGDQVMTDIWGGNRCGLPTILVEPLSGIEFIGTRLVSRNVERLILRALERRGARIERIERIVPEVDGEAGAPDR
jgi:predicted HAD superfamily phosphohydrolase YqeG